MGPSVDAKSVSIMKFAWICEALQVRGRLWDAIEHNFIIWNTKYFLQCMRSLLMRPLLTDPHVKWQLCHCFVTPIYTVFMILNVKIGICE